MRKTSLRPVRSPFPKQQRCAGSLCSCQIPQTLPQVDAGRCRSWNRAGEPPPYPLAGCRCVPEPEQPPRPHTWRGRGRAAPHAGQVPMCCQPPCEFLSAASAGDGKQACSARAGNLPPCRKRLTTRRGRRRRADHPRGRRTGRGGMWERNCASSQAGSSGTWEHCFWFPLSFLLVLAEAHPNTSAPSRCSPTGSLQTSTRCIWDIFATGCAQTPAGPVHRLQKLSSPAPCVYLPFQLIKPCTRGVCGVVCRAKATSLSISLSTVRLPRCRQLSWLHSRPSTAGTVPQFPHCPLDISHHGPADQLPVVGGSGNVALFLLCG